MIAFTLAAVSVVWLDQVSKALVGRLPARRPVPVGPAVRVHPVANAGWRLGTWLPGSVLVALWALGAAGAAVLVALGGFASGWMFSLGLAAAVGGAGANLVDWLKRGEIVDFVEIGFWPPFNLADAAIVGGVALAMTGLLL
jgi:signal peptidase II